LLKGPVFGFCGNGVFGDLRCRSIRAGGRKYPVSARLWVGDQTDQLTPRRRPFVARNFVRLGIAFSLRRRPILDLPVNFGSKCSRDAMEAKRSDSVTGDEAVDADLRIHRRAAMRALARASRRVCRNVQSRSVANGSANEVAAGFMPETLATRLIRERFGGGRAAVWRKSGKGARPLASDISAQRRSPLTSEAATAMGKR